MPYNEVQICHLCITLFLDTQAVGLLTLKGPFGQILYKTYNLIVYVQVIDFRIFWCTLL